MILSKRRWKISFLPCMILLPIRGSIWQLLGNIHHYVVMNYCVVYIWPISWWKMCFVRQGSRNERTHALRWYLQPMKSIRNRSWWYWYGLFQYANNRTYCKYFWWWKMRRKNFSIWNLFQGGLIMAVVRHRVGRSFQEGWRSFHHRNNYPAYAVGGRFGRSFKYDLPIQSYWFCCIWAGSPDSEESIITTMRFCCNGFNFPLSVRTSSDGRKNLFRCMYAVIWLLPVRARWKGWFWCWYGKLIFAW